MLPIFTIGHSDHALDAFLALLVQHHIGALADVRSAPYSRRLPHFSKAALAEALAGAGITYAYLGERLGGRPSPRVRAEMTGEGYAAMAATPTFQAGIGRILDGSRHHRVVLMCAERDPIDCHRALLVGRVLAGCGAPPCHIHADGSDESHVRFEQRLLEAMGHDGGGDLFASNDELLDLAYRRQELRAALASGGDEAAP